MTGMNYVIFQSGLVRIFNNQIQTSHLLIVIILEFVNSQNPAKMVEKERRNNGTS
jgi:hypothetical protein